MNRPIDPLTARQLANAARRRLDVTAARLRDQLGPDEVVSRLSDAAARKSQQFAASLATRAATSRPVLAIALLVGIGIALRTMFNRPRGPASGQPEPGKDDA